MTKGHNSVNAGQLSSIIQRVENLEDERRKIGADIKEVFAEAKGNGYDVSALKALIRERREDAEKRAEREAMVELYRHTVNA